MHEHADHDQHGRAHGHAPASFGMAFAVGIGLNLTFVAVEFVYGVLANSVALMADAGHNLSDVLGLAIAWIASVLTRRAPSSRFTYGLGGSSILAALFNAVLLLLAVGAIAWEAVLRLFHPEPVASGIVMIVATVGIVVNGVTAVARRKETRLIIEWSSIIVAPGSAPSCFGRVTGRAAICLSVNFSYNTACRELSDYSGISTVN
jgi:cobalt-zinc-cadmium efflux system protein